MVSTFQHFELVRLAEFMEVYGVARNSYRDVGVEFGVFHSLYEFFAVDNVYVKVMRALREVTVEHVYEVVYALFFVSPSADGVIEKVFEMPSRQYS